MGSLHGADRFPLEQIGKALFTPLARHANFSSRTADPIAPGGRAIDLSTLLHFCLGRLPKKSKSNPLLPTKLRKRTVRGNWC